MAASLSLPDHSLTGSHSTCTLYHLLCVFNYPSLHYLIPSFLFSSPPPLKYLHLISSFVSYLPLVFISLLSPLFEFLSLSSSSPLFILSGRGVLERCSATANCLLQGAKRGGRGNLWETEGPCCRRKSWCTARYLNTVCFTSSVFVGFLSGLHCVELPAGFFQSCGWTLGYKSCTIKGLEDNDSASLVLTCLYCVSWMMGVKRLQRLALCFICEEWFLPQWGSPK